MRILGIRVDEIQMQEARGLILDRLRLPREQRGFAQVVTLNPEGVMLARQDPALRRILEEAALVTADGYGLLWAAQKLGHPLPERVTGIDLIAKLAEAAAQDSRSLYLLGARPGYAELAAETLRSRYPGLIIAGVENGYFRDREPEVLAALHKAKPDILLTALGMPYQEHWLYGHRALLSGMVAVGVGGSFDVLAGKVKRAPRLWQALRLEWLWRLLADPKRWRRSLAIPRFMRAVLAEAKKQKK